MNRKTICFLLPSFFEENQGGAEYQVYIIAEELIKKGHDVHYIFQSNNGSPPENKLNLKLHPLRTRKSVRKYFGKDFIFDAPKILQILKQIGPDIVYQRVGCAYTGIAAFYCKNFQKRFIWHISHEKLLMPFKFTFNKSFFANLADHKCFAYGIKNADIILAQTDRQKKLLKQNYNIECDAVIPNFHPRPKTHWDQKRPDKVNVVWVANWKHWKHPEWFVEIARQMQEEKRAKFIMIGRAGLNPHQKNKLLNEINLLSNLQYLGELPFDQVNEIL